MAQSAHPAECVIHMIIVYRVEQACGQDYDGQFHRPSTRISYAFLILSRILVVSFVKPIFVLVLAFQLVEVHAR